MNAVALTQASSLSQLDWRVIEIAKRDGPSSIHAEGRLTKFLRHVFGLPVARKLANEKLESLRRFCVRAWYWDLIRTKDLRLLMDAGYSSRDAFQILAYISGYRGFTPSLQQPAP
jgi:hypothetical protein